MSKPTKPDPLTGSPVSEDEQRRAAARGNRVEANEIAIGSGAIMLEGAEAAAAAASAGSARISRMTTIQDATRAWARGLYSVEAGVELLIRGGKAIYDRAPWIERSGELAAIDTEKLREAAGAWSGGERRLVSIACSLIDGSPVDLSDAIPGLDRRGTILVLAAMAHANGSHEHSGITFDDDGAPVGFYPETSLYPWPDLESEHGPLFTAP